MKIIVMGAGVIGATTAYFLARQGYDVTVIDKERGPGFGSSYANGSQLSYSHVDPWYAGSSMLSIVSSAILSSFKQSSFVTTNYVSGFDKDFLKWLRKFTSKTNEDANIANLATLSFYSKLATEQVIEDEPEIKFHYKGSGSVHIFRKQKSFDYACRIADLKKDHGIEYDIIGKREILEKEIMLERALEEGGGLVGGIFCPGDAVGDCKEFTKNLCNLLEKKYGVKFLYNTSIENIFTNNKKITGVNTDKGVFAADKYVYALGVFGDRLLRGIKLNTSIYPVKGYSLSIRASDVQAPKATIVDSENRMVYSRIGKTFRAAGTIEISGLNKSSNKRNIRFIKSCLQKTFLQYGDMSNAQEWCGFRPFRPNAIPLICKVKKYPNMFINSGHGSLGWTLACGSAKIISSIIDSESSSEKEGFGFLKNEEKSLY